MRTLQKFSTIGERPKDVPEGWSIWNAPRPLYGHQNWQGDFLHGRFYVAVEPDGDFADRFVKENISLDAWQIEYITEDDAVNRVKAGYPDYADEIEKMNRNELMSLFYDKFAMEGEQ